jgi:hypothetical protein
MVGLGKHLNVVQFEKNNKFNGYVTYWKNILMFHMQILVVVAEGHSHFITVKNLNNIVDPYRKFYK